MMPEMSSSSARCIQHAEKNERTTITTDDDDANDDK